MEIAMREEGIAWEGEAGPGVWQQLTRAAPGFDIMSDVKQEGKKSFLTLMSPPDDD